MAQASAAPLLALAAVLAGARTVSSPSGQSVGCGTPSPVTPGETAELPIADNGTARTFYMHVPTDYDASRPTALILTFHGWSGSGLSLVDQMTPLSDHSNFVVVGPNGLAENWYASWNGGGTTQVPFPGPRGPVCDESIADTYCYTSCETRPEGCHPCDWTTCNDDIAFTETLLDWVEGHLCVDLAKVYAIGFSNGATFTYAVSAALSSRIVAFVANSGTPHPGYEVPPTSPQSAMDIHGVNDRTCPADNESPGLGGTPPGQSSSDGWYYLDVTTTLKLWVDVLHAAQRAAGCADGDPPADPSDSPLYPTSADGVRGLSCVRLSSGCRSDEGLNQTQIVRCSFVGGHEVHSMMPEIAWDFFTGEATSCEDSDFCLQHRPGWGAEYTCDTSVEFCTGEYVSDMAACCPAACGLCPLPSRPHEAKFPTGQVIGGVGAYVVVAVLLCACCTTATVKRDDIRASLARRSAGRSLSLTRERSSSKEQPIITSA